MKNYKFCLLLLPFALSSCKKPAKETSTPIEFPTTSYTYLGAYDDQGKPILLEKDVISASLNDNIKATLPEHINITTTHPEFIKDADLVITTKSDVYITFVSERTGFSNSIGYYMYKTGSPPVKPADIQNVNFIFPNASSNDGGTLMSGDKVKLGTFDPGVSIGFVLLNNGWDKVAKVVNKNAPHFCSAKVLNPEDNIQLKPHTILFNYSAENKVMIGFEDTDRSLPECDDDFNDEVIYATFVAK
ncbi:MAG: DUF4114 domain-containing protein [Flavobacterium sp.]|nr:DUF4114 domain-containing protein [Pedobacter sp.]